jgi:hypothetical protein
MGAIEALIQALSYVCTPLVHTWFQKLPSDKSWLVWLAPSEITQRPEPPEGTCMFLVLVLSIDAGVV